MCSFILKCVDWAAPKFCKYGDVGIVAITLVECLFVLYLKSQEIIILEVFSPCGRGLIPWDNDVDKSARRLLPGSSSSRETFESMNQWIQECSSNHTLCHSHDKEDSIDCKHPKRILDLSNGSIVLRENFQSKRYACLSHCWSSAADVPMTTSSTLRKLKRRVPVNILTKTFKDAVSICRGLGIPYLWIDSLCIYTQRSIINHLKILRFAPQFFEGFHANPLYVYG
ncbi:HET-domain-containing protein [Mytilinidion resinicola]|uniref:HET-domain-containing protein n=1 Tax=Mytilinidion resinicola TaxID=574789 RepID=A0A6A6YC43_9PEZI|nr:HET-domain-containing protein [Mytilinidion resinicola]KAF2806083.1 HET-domain-containing protein [Mytilinidion resinicola]